MWREVSFLVDGDAVERWSDALLEAGALSVQSEDADADSPDEQPLFGEPGLPTPATSGWRRTRLAALLRDDQDPVAVLSSAADLIGESTPLDHATRRFDDQDWVRLSQSQFEPIPVGERLLITPSWHATDEVTDGAASAGAAGGGHSGAGRVAIVLDPGLAFGTGSHPTTRLCLRWLERHLRAGESVIDYGCGSGILAIAAARLAPCASIVGIDIDPQALIAARANAERNRAVMRVQGTDAPLPEPADVVLANILATPLKLLAPLLQSLVRPGGALILAGLLSRQADEIAALYEQVPLTAFADEDGWTCLAGRKPR
ncbi:MAG: 50S ribosomal protein L11 methyltransferase [Burkholderiaceae bacterium]